MSRSSCRRPRTSSRLAEKRTILTSGHGATRRYSPGNRSRRPGSQLHNNLPRVRHHAENPLHHRPRRGGSWASSTPSASADSPPPSISPPCSGTILQCQCTRGEAATGLVTGILRQRRTPEQGPEQGKVRPTGTGQVPTLADGWHRPYCTSRAKFGPPEPVKSQLWQMDGTVRIVPEA